MGAVLGVLTAVIGVALGIFLGLYVCLYGGLVQIINAASAHPLQGGHLGLGIFRVLIASFVTWVLVFAGIALGGILANEL